MTWIFWHFVTLHPCSTTWEILGVRTEEAGRSTPVGGDVAATHGDPQTCGFLDTWCTTATATPWLYR